ncbi:HAMP domain-containing protein [Pelagicoccus albus]|uniref:histidine kinase n=1 Tax=Pelagicoccus albus TaxID=415222 RepID=A0A7X1BA08_9BACT|nr:HAMP domain-containing protein [Pelagicoccus albus]MBC2607153.1 sensor histidine kinase [Pelagicoccus albus]
MRLIRLDEGGKEVLRLDRINGEIVRVREEDLQQKGNRTYFRETVSKERDGAYFSAINLNREHGVIELPYKPTLRIAQQVRSPDGSLLGIVIGNLSFDQFLSRLLSDDIERFHLFLTNSDGYYLFGRGEDELFGFDLNTESNAQRDYPETESYFLGSSQSEDLIEGNYPFFDYTLTHLHRLEISEADRVLHMGIQVVYAGFSLGSGFALIALLVVVTVFLILGITVTSYLSAGITRPLEVIVEATDDFARGETSQTLPVTHNDEIGVLARSFVEMRSSVTRQREAVVKANEQLSLANRDLSNFAHIASHELREPINRISMLTEIAKSELSSAETEVDREVVNLLDSLRKESLKLLRQISDFRHFAGLSVGVLVREETEVVQLIRDALSEFSVQLRGLQIKVDIEEIPPLMTYASLLRSVYRNLTDSLLKFPQMRDASIRYTFGLVDDCPALGVLYDGSPEVAQEIAAAFDTSFEYNEPSNSTEIGLSLCLKIIARHKGRFWIETKDSQSHIRFTLGQDSIA